MGYVAAVMGMISLIGASKATKAAEREATLAAGAEKFITGAKIANLRTEERNMAGATRAIAAGSGVKAGTGSPLTILAEQAKQFERERVITRQVGASKVASVLERGRNVGSAALYQGYAGAAQAAASAFSYYGG